MLEQLKELINDFINDNGLNTYKVRAIIKDGGKNPLGASINVIDGIIKKDKLPKSRTTFLKILEAIGAEYETDSIGNINILSNGDDNNN